MTLSSNSTVCRLLIYCFLFSPKVKQGEGSRTHFDTGRENRGPSFSPSHPSHNTIAVTEYRAVELSGNCRRTLIPSRQQLIIHLPIEELIQNNAVKTNVETSRETQATCDGFWRETHPVARRATRLPKCWREKSFPFKSCQFCWVFYFY